MPASGQFVIIARKSLTIRLIRSHQFLLLVGLVIRLAGVAFMIRSRGANGTPIELVLNQALQGIGGGFASVTLQVSAQAGVSHAEVATVIAMVMLITEVGNSVGSAST
jgi:hypothetical protein